MAIPPSKINLLKRTLTFGLSNIWRNKLLSLATIFVMGIILFIFNIILSVNFIADDALTQLSKKIDIVVYLKDTTTLDEANNIISDLKNLEGIENISYTSKDDAYLQIKKTHPDLSLAFEKYKLGNPLPASINISTGHPKYHAPIQEILANDKYQKYLSSITGNEEKDNIISNVSDNLLAVSNFTDQVIFWLITIFIIGGALITLNAIQVTIFTRRKEIEVMKLVGASYWFIRLPFIIESIIYALAAVILSSLMILIVSQKISIQGNNLWVYFSNTQFLIILFLELAISMILSIGSAMIAVHEHLLRKKA